MNADDLPEPLVPLDHDVSMLSDFRLNVDRLLASELLAIGTAEECWAAFMLWCRAWKQQPGGSLPNDDRILAGFSGAGRRWKQVREVALHGFVLCSDGRLYHRFLCDEVRRAYASHLANEARREADRKRLSDWREKRARKAAETPDETHFVAEEPEPKPEPQKERAVANATGAEAPPDPLKAMWDRGKALLGKSSGGLIGKACKEHGPEAVLAAIIACEHECPVQPVEFFIGCLRGQSRKRSAVEKLYAGAMEAADELTRRQQANGGPDFTPLGPLLDRR